VCTARSDKELYQDEEDNNFAPGVEEAVMEWAMVWSVRKARSDEEERHRIAEFNEDQLEHGLHASKLHDGWGKYWCQQAVVQAVIIFSSSDEE
jgi:hypothetical protein